ncbi:hypothetical protein HGRIS_004084 [Hohenbuehelia grisea]
MADVADPELEPPEPPVPPLSKSTEDLLANVHLPPRPSVINEDYEVQALEEVFQKASRNDDSPLESLPPTPSSAGQEKQPSLSSAVAADLRQLHLNLETRLLPFWSSVLAGRTVRINLYAAPRHNENAQGVKDNGLVDMMQESFSHGPVVSREVTTGVDGSFVGRFTINWEELCEHPGALHIAFGDSLIEHDLLVSAELLPPSTPPSSASSSASDASTHSARLPAPGSKPRYDRMYMDPAKYAPTPLPPTASATIRMPLTHSPIRIISDIDDTVKRADILSGARAVFHTVFVKELKDIIIPGMGEWYMSMFKRGVRFHYVSNGPFELLPVISEFFEVSNLPPGSIKLKSYSGRSLFNGLLSAPATRKRAGIQEILDSFPESRFLLVGDSGEQDLELYAEFAKERPDQILGVFIRYVDDGEMIPDPTGWQTLGASAQATPRVSNYVDGGVTPHPGATPTSAKPSARQRAITGLRTAIPKAKSLSLSINIPSPRSTPPNSRPSTPSAALSSGDGYFTSQPLSVEPEGMSNGNSNGSSSGGSGKGSAMSANQPSYKARGGYDATAPGPSSARAYTPRQGSAHSVNSFLGLGPPTPASAAPSMASATSGLSGLSGLSAFSSSSAYSRLPEPERKRAELQVRVYRARTQMPGHIPLRIFRSPEDCIEAEAILRREGNGD